MVGPFQEENGAVSMRRILALICIVAAVALGFGALTYATAGWWVFIPAVGFIVASLLFVFFTTWEAIKGIIAAAKDLKG